MSTCSVCKFHHGEVYAGVALWCALYPSGPGLRKDCPDYRDAIGVPMVGRVVVNPWAGQMGEVVGWDRYEMKLDVAWDDGREMQGVPLEYFHRSSGTELAFV